LRNRDFDIVDRHLETALDYCTGRDLDLWRLFLLACRSGLELGRARWDAAARSASLALDDPRTWPVPRVFALTVLGLARVRRGHDGGRKLLDEALELAE